MTSHYAPKKQFLSLEAGGDEQQEEGNAEFVKKIAVLDGGEDCVSIEPLTVFSQAGMTNKETTADLASNVTVTSGAKCNAVLNETLQLSVNSDIIWGDDSDYRRQEDTVDQKGLIVSCCKAHTLEQENDAQWTSSHHPDNLNSHGSVHKSTSSLRRSLPGNRSPSPNGASLHCETRTVSEEAGMFAPETCSSDQFPIQGPNLEEETVALKKSQDRNKGNIDNDRMKNNVVTGFQSADVESGMSALPPHCSRESSLGSSNIVMSSHHSLALASVQSADGDSSRIFTPDVASSKGICSRARVAGRGGCATQIPDYPRRLKQDSLLSPGNTSQSDNNILITFPQQHSSNNCSLISAGTDLSPSCEYFGGSSDNVSTIRSNSQDKDGQTWNLRDAETLDKEHRHSCHSGDLFNSQTCQPVTLHVDKEDKSRIQEKLKDDRKIQVSDAVTSHGHSLQHKQGGRLQDDLPLTSKFQTFSSPARTAVKPACSHPLQPESSTSRFSLLSSYSSPDIVNAECCGIPLLNNDTYNEFHNYDNISTQVRDGLLQTRHQSRKLESGASLPGVCAEGTANIGTTLSCSSPAISEHIHPFIQRPGITDSSTSANTGFSETSSTGHNYMRFQGSNNNLYSRLGNPYSDNQLPRISRSPISRYFDQRRHSSSPDVSLRTCSSCSNVDFSYGLRSTTRQGAPEADNEDDLLRENQLHPETASQPDYPETGDVFDSLLSVLVDKAVSDHKINKPSSATQEEDNDCKRSVVFFKDAQRKYICEDGSHTESNRNTRSGRLHKKNLSHSRTYNADTRNIPMSNSTAKSCMAQVYTEAQPCLKAPVIRITTSTLPGDASQSLSADTIAQTALSQSSSSPAPGTEVFSAVTASHKPRVSFINGLRRLSREKTAFLRVDQPWSNTLRAQSSATQSVEKQDEYETGRAGKRFGRENKRRLKVEFAIMDTDSDQTAHNKQSGNIGSGFLSIKDDVENDVAMLGGGGGRFRHPRVSLLGKPLNYKAHRRDVSYRRLQARIYNFLERPKSWQSWIYHLAMFLFVLLCLTLGVLSSITEFEKLLLQYAVYLDIAVNISIFQLIVDFLARLRSVVCHCFLSGRLTYPEIVMLLWIVLELGLRVWSAGCRSRYQGQSGRLRFLRRPLCIIDMILVLASVSSLIVGSTQEHFSQAVLSGLRFFQILRMVRMDRKGGTWKLLGSVVWAHRQELVTTLYIGLLGLVFSSYFVYLAEKDEPRLENSPKSQFNHTEYKPKFSNFADAIWWGVVTLCTVGYGDVVPATWGGKVIASFSAILGISFFALPAGILGSGFALKVQQQQRQKHLNRRRIPAANLIQCLWRCYAADELSMSTATWKRHLIPCPSPPSERTFKNNTSFVSRFSTRRRDRSSATGSFSRDGIQAQSPMSARHHSRRAAISTSEEEVTTVLDRSHLSLATGASEQKYQLDPLPFKKENSVSSIGKESEEEDLSPRLTQLTEQHKRIIRVIRKIRYFVARRKFREALRPYDVKDVIEQYSAGHIDMLARIKNLQGRLDQILGRQGSKSKDVYESKICLASRIVKVERQVEDIETKLDMLLDMYKDDRKLLLQHLNISQKGAIQVGPSHPPPPPPAPSSQFKPRPILIDKQFTSEPATPTGIGFASSPRGRLHGIKPVIQRNLSDLSQRIKKRVTYRGLYLQDPPSRAQSAANFASIQPSTFPVATPVPTATSPDEMSSTTVSETTRDESSENIISLNDVDLPLIFGTTITTGESQQEANSSTQAGSSDSAASLYNTEETYFFSNSNLCQSLKSIQQKQMSSSPLNSPLMRVKILSTLNEQQSLESDTSQSCASSSPPTPPTNKTAAEVSRTTPPSSLHQSPLIQRQRHLSGTENSSISQKSSPLSSRRPHKPILRLPPTLASTVASSEEFTTTDTSPQSLTTSNYANNAQDVFFQIEDTSKLCNLEDESTEIAGVTNRSCKTSEL